MGQGQVYGPPLRSRRSRHCLDMECHGKAESAWSLDPSSDESKKGFLLNHLISEELSLGGFSVSNSDPITGQAGWYDVRVKLAAADENEPEETWPQVKAHRVPGMITK